MVRAHYLSRPVLFVPGPVAGAGGWEYLHEPFRVTGLAVLGTAAFIAWPVLVLVIVFGIPAALLGLIPRRWRKHGQKPVPAWFRRIIRSADRNRCSACRQAAWGRFSHVDHFLPQSLGGCTTLFNCFLLCEPCNAAKSNAWVFRGKFWPGASWNPGRARWVLRRERLHRWNIFRWLRAAWAVGT